MPTDKQRLLELETQFMYHNDMLTKMQHDLSTIKRVVTEINIKFNDIKKNCKQLKLIE